MMVIKVWLKEKLTIRLKLVNTALVMQPLLQGWQQFAN
jgi:hypothetical protein